VPPSIEIALACKHECETEAASPDTDDSHNNDIHDILHIAEVRLFDDKNTAVEK
jgi:hypothetical protein